MTNPKQSQPPILLPAPAPKKTLGWRRVIGRTALVMAVFLLLIWGWQIGQLLPKVKDYSDSTPIKIWPTKKTPPLFPTVEVQARSAVVYDLSTNKILYAKNANQILPLASLTKLMTVLVATQTLKDQTIVKVKNEQGQTEIWRAEDLTDYVLVNSYNQGARALALASAGQDYQSFIKKMNQEKNDLGLTKLHFYNPTGLDGYDQAGAYGSALEVAKLHAFIYNHQPKLLEATKKPFIIRNAVASSSQLIINTNSAINKLPGLRSSKTGTTPLAGANLSIILDVGLNQPVAIVILGSTEEARFSDIKKLAQATIKFLAQ
ncbi:MAG: hypothetical protein A2607_01370 [Candidatus Vogelbacteria bacterium RIFOXYD1_FULL_42_15]|uniref:Peptidase S11 D-alanyl-D-alanine carboxypeptidase A N-terminal domain-containing protein n=1 Tax=Candidatus Vogelbacteria bacterium RIFOXYD1_FULL_42_15 TaxID=1802437 RepID=A0A1G2QE64_9BACT|nr:MAG: hypothetical protein A2607_01370 [Candidatus Vogelbacteria bacterium RIFOXYD1_FULL_42_15]